MAWYQTLGSPTCRRLEKRSEQNCCHNLLLSHETGRNRHKNEWKQATHDLTKHPDITGCGKSSKVDGLGSHPFNWKFTLRCWNEINQRNCVHLSSLMKNFKKINCLEAWRDYNYLCNKSCLPCTVTNQSHPVSHSQLSTPTRSVLQCLCRNKSSQSDIGFS